VAVTKRPYTALVLAHFLCISRMGDFPNPGEGLTERPAPDIERITKCTPIFTPLILPYTPLEK